jgi:hypothetical protein
MKFILCLIKVLEISIKKNGADKPLTLGHLLNILKMTLKIQMRIESAERATNEEWEKEFFEDAYRYGFGD